MIQKFGEEGNLIGDPTETALVQFGMDQGFQRDERSSECRTSCSGSAILIRIVNSMSTIHPHQQEMVVI